MDKPNEIREYWQSGHEIVMTYVDAEGMIIREIRMSQLDAEAFQFFLNNVL